MIQLYVFSAKAKFGPMTLSPIRASTSVTVDASVILCDGFVSVEAFTVTILYKYSTVIKQQSSC